MFSRRLVASHNFALCLLIWTRIVMLPIAQSCTITLQSLDFHEDPVSILRPQGFVLIAVADGELIQTIDIGGRVYRVNAQEYRFNNMDIKEQNLFGQNFVVKCNNIDYQKTMFTYAPCKRCPYHTSDTCYGCIENSSGQQCAPTVNDCSLHSRSPWQYACLATSGGPATADTECHAFAMRAPVTHLTTDAAVCSTDGPESVFPLLLKKRIYLLDRKPDDLDEYTVVPMHVGETAVVLDRDHLYDSILGVNCLQGTTVSCYFRSIPELNFDLCEYVDVPLTYDYWRVQYQTDENDKFICDQMDNGILQAHFYIYVIFAEVDFVPLTCPDVEEDTGEALEVTCHWKYRAPFKHSSEALTMAKIVAGISAEDMTELYGYACATKLMICNPWKQSIGVVIYATRDYCHQEKEEFIPDITGFLIDDSTELATEIDYIKGKYLAAAGAIIFVGLLFLMYRMCRAYKLNIPDLLLNEELKDDEGVVADETLSNISVSQMGLVQRKPIDSVMSAETKMTNTKSMELFFKTLRDLDIKENPSLDLTPSSTATESLRGHKREPRMLLYTKPRAHTKEDAEVQVCRTGIETEPEPDPPGLWNYESHFWGFGKVKGGD